MWDNKVVEMLNDNEKLVSFCKHEFTTQTKVVFPKVLKLFGCWSSTTIFAGNALKVEFHFFKNINEHRLKVRFRWLSKVRIGYGLRSG